MLFERFEARGLAHFSYIIGCEHSRQIAVIDPKRDTDCYTSFAESRGYVISHVLETHIHADYASGAKTLAEISGAQACLSAYDSGEVFEVQFPHRRLADGEIVQVGSISLKVLHTPGHTPEHISFLVSEAGGLPHLMLSGDFLFVGSVGRPDLLGEEAKLILAKRLFRSIRQTLLTLPDDLKICPAHGAGSMCGAGLGQEPTTTLGMQRAKNPFLRSDFTEDAFIEFVLATVPPFPDYYRRMKALNSKGAPAMDIQCLLREISPSEFSTLRDSGAAVIDTRDRISFSKGHIPGAYGIGTSPQFAIWSSWVLPYDTPLVLIVKENEDKEALVRDLLRVGLDNIQGFLKGGACAWTAAGKELRQLQQLNAAEFAQQLETGKLTQVIDVRNKSEWDSGHIKGAIHIPCNDLKENLGLIDSNAKTTGICCAGGYRSTIAASILEQHGISNLINLNGGMKAWREAGLPEIK